MRCHLWLQPRLDLLASPLPDVFTRARHQTALSGVLRRPAPQASLILALLFRPDCTAGSRRRPGGLHAGLGGFGSVYS